MKRFRLLLAALVLVVVACPVSSPTDPPPTGTTVPTGDWVVSPSGGDDTDNLVAAVQAHPRVLINAPLKVDKIAAFGSVSDRVITFSGSGALVRTAVNNPTGDLVTFPVMQFIGGSNVTLVNPQIQGPGGVCNVPRPGGGVFRAYYDSRYEESSGVELNGVQNFTIQGGNIHDVKGDGVRIFYNYKVSPSQPSRNVTISDLTTNCTGRAGVTNVSSDQVVVNKGRYDNAGLWVFNVEPFNALTVTNYTINQPTVGYSSSSWLFVGGLYFRCTPVAVANIHVNGPVFLGLHMDRSVISCAVPQVTVA